MLSIAAAAAAGAAACLLVGHALARLRMRGTGPGVEAGGRPAPGRSRRILRAALGAAGAAGGLAVHAATGFPLLVPALAAAGFLLPAWFAGRGARRRRARIEEQLEDALSVLSSALRAGMSFPQAAANLVREMGPPLSDEFRLLLAEQRLGLSLEEAIGRLASRVATDDARLLATVVQVSRQTGGNLAERLDTLAATVRERRRLAGQVRSLTAQGRMSGMVVGSLPAVLLAAMAVIDPGLVAPMFTTAAGVLLLALAATLLGLGALLIRRIVTIPA